MGQSIQHVTSQELERRVTEFADAHLAGRYGREFGMALERLRATLGDTYAAVEWAEPYYRAAGSFWGETVPRLLRLGRPEDVRIVFFFDN